MSMSIHNNPDAGTYYYSQDGIGSVRNVTDSIGEIRNSYGYTAFGEPYDTTATVRQPYVYTGREQNALSGGMQYRFRNYDPMLGRFDRRDPIGYLGGINQYIYVENMPYSYVDPYGLNPAMCYRAVPDEGDDAEGDDDPNSDSSRPGMPYPYIFPGFKGRSQGQVEKALNAAGFIETKRSSPANNTIFKHPDGRMAYVHPNGNQNWTDYKSGNNAHGHKFAPDGTKLNDRGYPGKTPADVHIGMRNPPGLPALRGRPHGAGPQPIGGGGIGASGGMTPTPDVTTTIPGKVKK